MLTIDRNEPQLNEHDDTGQQKAYLILSEEELSKGFVRPVRQSYIHLKCGTVTTMGLKLSETYARDPKFYSGTFCCYCQAHFDLIDEKGNRAFKWADLSGYVGE
jgi:hypothetical protein